MGKLLPSYQKSIVEDIVYSVKSNNAHYYAFAANPIEYTGESPSLTDDNYSKLFINDWQMMFGKKILSGDIAPVISNKIWQSGTVYTRYDNTVENLTNYYVVSEPSIPGGDYCIYVCIDNNNGGQSTQKPILIQPDSFTYKDYDNYTWRYITSIPNAYYAKFATEDYIPLIANSQIQTAAYNSCGVEVIVINNKGSGYQCYTNGIVQSVFPGGSRVQLELKSSIDTDYYTGSGIYFYHTDSTLAEIKYINHYFIDAMSGAKYVVLDSPVNTDIVVAGITLYDIAPAVVFESDGEEHPKARSIVNPVGNTVDTIQIIKSGTGVSWCNVHIQSNTSFGSGANVYAIVPPPGGHGYNPFSELNVNGFGLSFFFSNTESNTIITDTVYNKIGIIKSPHEINQVNGSRINIIYIGNTFSSVLSANVTTQFTIGTNVIGKQSNATGTVAYSNSTVLYLTGDKHFKNNEPVVCTTSTTNSHIIINNRGDVYTKDISPLYVQNISNVNRSGNNIEFFKLIIKV